MIILQGKNLKKSYITNLIFENLDFHIQEGEKVGLVGPNGTGKSTLFRCITGEDSFDEGQLQMSARHSMGYMEQMPEFAPNFTLLDAVMEMFNDIFAMRDQLRQLELEMGGVEGDALEKLLEEYSALTHRYEDLGGFSCESRAKGIIKGLGFTDADFSREIACFSGGEKTRASLARLLVREPDLLLLDEPTRGIDVGAKYEIYQLIIDLANEGKGVIMVSSEMPELLGVCDRILVMSGGQVAGEVDAKNTSQEEILTLAAKYV